jgi:ankyrin repeat protein
MSELFDAIRSGDLSRVSAAIESDPGSMRELENGATPILLAIYHGKNDVAALLASRAPAISFAEACALGDMETVRAMLGGDESLLHTRSPDGFPAFALAIFFQHPDVAQFLIERGADVSAVADNPARVAPIHAAAAVCDRETMRMLLERGADPNLPQQQNVTALHGAASRGDIEMAKLLLEHGADPAAKSADGMDAAAMARKYGKDEFAEWFEKRSSPVEPS